MSEYKDPAHLTASDFNLSEDPNVTAKKIAQWIRTKAYGIDVRESLAFWVEVNQAVYAELIENQTEFINEVNNTRSNLEERQEQVESRQSDVEDQFKSVIANATKDSEVILARDLARFGNFSVLDDRFEYIEELLSKYVPAGFNVTIKHNQNRQPKVVVHYYEYAIGTEDDGLGTGPYGFGETTPQEIAAQVDYPDDDTCIVHLPSSFALTGVVTYKAGYWYLIDGHRTLRFDLGNVDDAKATAGNGDNSTSTDSTGGNDDSGSGTTTDPTDEIPTAPTDLTATQIDDETEKLDWE